LSQRKKLSELKEGLTIYPQLLTNIKVTDKDAVINAPEVLKAKEEAEASLMGDGRVILRKSGTEPLIRVMVEGKNDEICKEVTDKIVTVIDKSGFVK